MSGVVEAVSTKDVATKFGTKPTYTFKVGGNWIKHGFKNPNVNVGDTVEFDGVTGTYGTETKSVNVLAKGVGALVSGATSASPVPTRSYPVPNTGRVFPIPALHGDRSIVRQNALARATDLLIASQGGKVFSLTEIMADIAIHVARRFEAYTAGDLDMVAAMTPEGSVESDA